MTTTTPAEITVKKKGRRHYLVGNTFAHRDRLRDAGCRWDPDERAWWTGKAELAEELLGELNGASTMSGKGNEASGGGTVVAGRAEYEGRTYYITGRVLRGRTAWDDEVEPVTTRDGAKLLLSFRDGSKTFWAAAEAVRITRRYERPQTIDGLRRFAEQRRAGQPSRADVRQDIDWLEDQDRFDEAAALAQRHGIAY